MDASKYHESSASILSQSSPKGKTYSELPIIAGRTGLRTSNMVTKFQK